MFYSGSRGDGPPHLSAAAPVLCSQQPNRTDTPSPRMSPLWGRTGENVVCVCVSSGSASGDCSVLGHFGLSQFVFYREE